MSAPITNATYARGKVSVSAGDYNYSRRQIGPDSVCCGNRGYTSLGGRQACAHSLRNESAGCSTADGSKQQVCDRVAIEDSVWRPQYAQFPLNSMALGNDYGPTNAGGYVHDNGEGAAYEPVTGGMEGVKRKNRYQNVGGATTGSPAAQQ